MKNKYFILAVTFLIFLVSQKGLAQEYNFDGNSTFKCDNCGIILPEDVDIFINYLQAANIVQFDYPEIGTSMTLEDIIKSLQGNGSGDSGNSTSNFDFNDYNNYVSNYNNNESNYSSDYDYIFNSSNGDPYGYGISYYFPPEPTTIWYFDYDGDGWHRSAMQTTTCPGAYWKLSSYGEDCDDNDETKTYFCAVVLSWYLDEDGDGYYSQIQQLEHSPGSHWSLWISPNNLDCDDTNKNLTSICCPAGYILVNDICTDPCDMLKAAAEVYDLNPDTTSQNNMATTIGGNWGLADVSNINGLELKKDNIGFNSALYVREVNGVQQYMYATEGTDIIHDFNNDMTANAMQLLGTSDQYSLSKNNAIIISNYVNDTGGTLVFVGHSLGGGLASYNALATGWDAFTYNAAGLTDATKANLDYIYSANINASVVRGEIVDQLQSIIGLKAESSNGINYINGPSTPWINLLAALSSIDQTRLYGTAEEILRINAHLIDELKTALNCN